MLDNLVEGGIDPSRSTLGVRQVSCIAARTAAPAFFSSYAISPRPGKEKGAINETKIYERGGQL